jgi:isoquinoline 1-oxidoreductase
MSSFDSSSFVLEPERYELQNDPLFHLEIDRRKFFKTLGCGVVVLFLVDAVLAQESGGGGRRGGRGGARPAEISAWLHIGEDGTVTVFTGKVEIGQNIRTSLTQAVAEELRVPPASIHLVMADTAQVPFDAGTFGSRSTPDMGSQLHKAAAAAREALLDLAADFFKADRSSLSAADGKISSSATKASVSYGELTKGQKLLKSVTDASPTTPASQWKIAGTSLPRVNGRELVTGAHKYASDVKLPGMLHGTILRPAKLSATLVSVDTKAAESMKDVTVVHNGNFVGVVAPDTLLAARAVQAIKAEWKSSPQPSSDELYDYLKKHASASGGRGGQSGGNRGSMEDGLAAADHKLTQTYHIAYIAHAPLEPRAAVAEWKDDKLTVWTGTQRPFGVRSELAREFNLSEDHVRVIAPDTGSGYGGKHTGDAAIEAATLAKAAGKPVKIVWTREEEFTWAYCRPAGVIDISSGVRSDGTLTAWEFNNYNSGGSAIRTPYEAPNQKIAFHGSESPLRQGSYRGLASTANNFARETHMDELARSVKMDPLDFRLKNLKDDRLRAVLNAAAKAFGWGSSKPSEGCGFGIACGTEKGGYLATCAEVSADAKTAAVKVLRAVTAFDCGAIVNPEHLKTQIEGAMVMGLGGALYEAIEFDDGVLRNPRFSDYRVPRFSDAPRIEVVLIDRKDLPSAGAGESPIMCIAPAVGNAICDATGIRLRSLPMIPKGLKA